MATIEPGVAPAAIPCDEPPAPRVFDDDPAARLVALEARFDSAFAYEARLKAIESKVDKLGKSSLRDWVGTLGPYLSGLLVLVVGFMIKDSVGLALQREQLDLNAVMNMRDLIRDLDTTKSREQADADAVALAMYGRHAVMPLVARLEHGDVAPLAALHGLELVGHDRGMACPLFLEVVDDRGRRYTWGTHKKLVKVLGSSSCTGAIPSLRAYGQAIDDLGGDREKTARFARRYSQPDGFNTDDAGSLRLALTEALAILETVPPP